MAKDGDVPHQGQSLTKDHPATFSALSGTNAQYLDAQYARYIADPGSVAPEWRRVFESLDGESGDNAPSQTPSWARS
ncbi:MAG: hypothetical protein AAGJ87_13110, partial [Pseudomonadota bacterium]